MLLWNHMPVKITIRSALRRSGLFDKEYEMKQALHDKRIVYKGNHVRELGFLFSPKQGLLVDGKPLVLLPLRYFIINKPHTTTCQKNEKYPYVVDLIKVDEHTKKTLFTVGRLDVPTTGLLIATNDGKLAQKILEPAKEIMKKYKVLLKQPLTDPMITALEKGVTILVDGKPYKTKPAAIEKIDKNNCFVSITEGKYRQVRLMFEAVGNRVMALCRVQIGGLKLDELKLDEGNYVEMKKEEVEKRIFRENERCAQGNLY